MLQDTDSQFVGLSVAEDIAFALENGAVPRTVMVEQVEHSAALVHMTGFLENSPFELSGGQKKRVTIASILVMQPKLLILDEPTAGQDYRHCTDIMEFLRGLNVREKLTIIFITRDMHLALEYTARSIVLTDGNLLRDDTMSRIFSDPQTIEKANLKLTSLYDLAGMAGMLFFGILLIRLSKIPFRIYRPFLFPMALLFVFTTHPTEFASSLEKAEEISNAMTLRGFGKRKRRSWYNARPLRRADAAVFAVMVIFPVFVLWMKGRTNAMFWYPF